MYQDQKFTINTAVATPPSTLPASRKRPHSAIGTPQLVASPSTPFRTPGSRIPALRSKPMSITENFATPENVLKKYGHDDGLLSDKHVVELYVPLIQFCAVNTCLVASWNSDAAKHILGLIRARAKSIADPADRKMENYQHLNALLHEVNSYAIQEKLKVPQDFYSLMYETALIACTNLETLKPRMEVIIFILNVLKMSLNVDMKQFMNAEADLQQQITLKLRLIDSMTNTPFQIYEHLQQLVKTFKEKRLPTNYYTTLCACFRIIFDSFSIWDVQKELGVWLSLQLVTKHKKRQPPLLHASVVIPDLKKTPNLATAQRVQYLLQTLAIPTQYNQMSDDKVLIDWMRNTVYLRHLGGEFCKFNNNIPDLMSMPSITDEIGSKLKISDPPLIAFLSRFATQEGLVGGFIKLWQEHLDYCAQVYAPIDPHYRYIYLDNQGTHLDVFCIMFIKCVSKSREMVMFSPKVPILFSCKIDWTKGLENCMSHLQASVLTHFIVDDENQLRDDWLKILKEVWPEK